MGKIIEASDLPIGEKVYLRKDFMGWRTVDPWKTPDGKINWFNFLLGGKRNLFILVVIMVVFGLVYLGILEYTSNLRLIAEEPCAFCVDCHEQVNKVLSTANQKLLFTLPTLPEGGET